MAALSAAAYFYFRSVREIFNFQAYFLFSEEDDDDDDGLFLLCRAKERKARVKITGYAENVVPQYRLDDFKRHFRLHRETFDIVQRLLATNCPVQHRRGRPPVDLSKQLLITLWVIGNPECLRSVADRFGVSASTAYVTYRRVCMDIVTHLAPLVIVWPTASQQRLRQIMEKFEQYQGLPQCIGCIDGTHIPIKAPSEREEDYLNRKGFHSILLQGVCDADYQFTDIYCGWPGSVHDARVLRNSPLCNEAQTTEECFPGGAYLIGDQAYPLKTWLMAPFRDTGALNHAQRSFNKRLSAKRQRIEQTFGLLKGRFRKLRVTMDVDVIEDIPTIVSASCVLHNICCMGEEDFLEYLDGPHDEEVNNFENIFQHDAEALGKRNELVALL